MKKKYTTETFIEKAKSVHGDKYDYSKVVYVDCESKVCIICPKHGEFWQKPVDHLNKRGCSKCRYDKNGDAKRMTTDEFAEKAKLIHGDKYDYSKVVYKGNKAPVIITCKIHGDFTQTPNSHLNGHGCPKCASEKLKRKPKVTFEEFIEKSKAMHGDYYDYSKVQYIDEFTPVTIICPKHGEFTQKPWRHMSGHKCRGCANEMNSQKNVKTQEEFIAQAKLIHGDKYDYSKVKYTRFRENVCIICPKHGEFWETPASHLRGCGCQTCGHINSHTEKELCAFIKECLNGEEVIENSKSVIKPYELDIFVPSRNIAFEFNGLYWHSDNFVRDSNYHLNKLLACNEKGIKLIQIYEDEWTEKLDLVKAKIKHILKINQNFPKIPARKCDIRKIDKDNANEFLKMWHIQGGCGCTVALGCFHNEELIAVMTFKREHKDGDTWELTRFASAPSVVCQGCGGKLFKHFLRAYRPSEVKSFADRRWTVSKDDNLYTKLGFELVKILPPDYMYVISKKRHHKFGFRKDKLHKLYDLPLTMTEKEMTAKLGFPRIWNCGLLKYVWKKD